LFGENAFGAVLAVDKWRDDSDAHVRRLAWNASEQSRERAELSRAWVDCITEKSEQVRGGGGERVFKFESFVWLKVAMKIP